MISIFDKNNDKREIVSLQHENLNIPKDAFLETTEYKNYELFRIEDRKADALLEVKKDLSSDFVKQYQSLNPNYWFVYYKTGLSFYQKKQYQLAKEQFEKALTKEITTLTEKLEIEKYLKKIERKLQ